MNLNALHTALGGICTYRPLMDTPLMQAVSQLLLACSFGSGEKALDLYGQVFYQLRAQGFQGLGDWLWDCLRYSDSPYGALKNGLVVCDGFAHLYQFMASYMGLQAPLIYTTSHAYNKVLLDDTWYVVDITIGACGWDAQEFFLTSDAVHEDHYSGETYCRSWYVTVCACPSSRPDLAYLIA